MYRSFYNLHSKPFSSTADPGFFWAGGVFSKILADVGKRVKESNGVLFLTGEPGTGKTMLANVLADLLDEEVLVRKILCLNFERMDSLNVIASALDFSGELNNEEEFIHKGKQFLHSCHLQGKKALIILDEAQHLDHGTLEDLFLLLRHDQKTGGSLSLLFVGHPNLGPVLDREIEKDLPKPSLTRFTVEQLSEKETVAYIRHRMETAGSVSEDIFREDALKEIHQFSAGCPALINTVCDLALLFGYTENKGEISRSIIEECEGKLQLAAGRTKKPFVAEKPSDKQEPQENLNAVEDASAAAMHDTSRSWKKEAEIGNKQQSPFSPAFQGEEITKRKLSMRRARIASLLGAFLVCIAFVSVLIPGVRQKAGFIFEDWGKRGGELPEKERHADLSSTPISSSPQSGQAVSGIGEGLPEKGQLTEHPTAEKHFSDYPAEVEADDAPSDSIPAGSAETTLHTINPSAPKVQGMGQRTAAGEPSGEKKEMEIAAVVHDPHDLQTFSSDVESLSQPHIALKQKEAEGQSIGSDGGLSQPMEKIIDHPENRPEDLSGVRAPKNKIVLSPSEIKKNRLTSAADSLKAQMAEKKVVGNSSPDEVLKKPPELDKTSVNNMDQMELEIHSKKGGATVLKQQGSGKHVGKTDKEISPDGEKEPLAEKDQKSEDAGPEKTDNPEAAEWINKSLQLLKKKQWDEAIEAASRAIALDPGQPESYANRAWAYIEKDFFEKALADIEIALTIAPTFVQAINNKGLVLERMGNQELAVDFYRQACNLGLELSCTNFEKIRGYPPKEEKKILLKESVERFVQGDYEAVIDLSSRVIKIDAGNAEAFSNRCGAKAVLGRLAEAEVDCIAAEGLDPDFSMTYNNRGVIEEKRGDLAAAKEFFQKSCDMKNSLGCNNAKRIINGK